MGKLSRFTYTLFVMLGTAALMTGGFAYGFTKTASKKFFTGAEEIRIAKEKEQEEKIAEDVAVNAKLNKKIQDEEEKIERVLDIEVTYVDEYTKCSHTVISKVNVFGTTIEKLKTKLSQDNQKKEYKLVEETETTLKYRKVINGYCPDHYLVKIEEKSVVIYKLDESSKIEYQRLTTPIEKLDDTLLSQLENGIELDSKEKLYSLIEAIES